VLVDRRYKVLPLDFYRLAYNEVLRRLQEQDPPSPSTKVRSLPKAPADTAQNRGVDGRSAEGFG
jgi:hypothetical protein